MNQRSRDLIKNIISFAFGKIGVRLISFLLVPVYTHILSTDEYGTLDLISTVCTVLVPILTLNIYESVMRFCLDKGADREQILSIATSVLAVGSVVGLLIIPISYLIPSFSSLSWYIYAYIVSAAVMQVFLAYLRGCERLNLYSIGNIIHTALSAVLNIVFLVGLRMGVQGYLLAYILSNLATAVFAVIVGQAYRAIKRFRFDKALINSMLRFSVVLIPNSFMWWIINSSDRAMVTAMAGAAANGIYAIAYKVPSLLTAISGVFNQSWIYTAIKENDSACADQYHDSVYNRMAQTLICLVAFILVFLKPFMSVYTSKEYYIAWKYTPFLLIGFLFLSLGTFLSTSYTVNKNGMGFLLSGIVGAVLNILLNFSLIPIIGAMGATIATCFSYIGVFAFRAVHTKKYVKIQTARKGHLIGYLLLAVMSGIEFVDAFWGEVLLIILFSIILYLNRGLFIAMLGALKTRRKEKRFYD
ncbi:MAG: oligosaccharide flippase family protein [Clostridia bacterium]|nr:oligosaccharide flippase family protein [Clostridia bacterium]